MNELITYTPIVAGVWMVGTALIMHTEDIPSSLVFKVVPFFIGTACLYTGAKLLELL